MVKGLAVVVGCEVNSVVVWGTSNVFPSEVVFTSVVRVVGVGLSALVWTGSDEIGVVCPPVGVAGPAVGVLLPAVGVVGVVVGDGADVCSAVVLSGAVVVVPGAVGVGDGAVDALAAGLVSSAVEEELSAAAKLSRRPGDRARTLKSNHDA